MPASASSPSGSTSGASSTKTTTAPCKHCGLPCCNVPIEVARKGDPVFCCAGCRIVYDLLDEQGTEQAVHRTLLRIGLGIFLTMNVMAFSFPFYGADLLHPQAESAAPMGGQSLDIVFRWFIFVMATAVILLLGTPIARDALENLKRFRIQSTLLISIGVGAAYVASAIAVIRADGPIYFDSACMVLTLVTIGYYIEGRMKLRAVNAATGKLADLPTEARVERGGEVLNVPADELVRNDVVRIASGESVPVDGRVIEGRGAVVESSITGEALPRSVTVDDEVWAGCILADGWLRVRALQVGSQRRIEQIIEMLTQSRLAPARIQRITDRVAAVFVPLAVLIAVAVFLMQWNLGDWREGVLRALAVALIACPCALGLAAPLATWCAVRHLARHHIVVRSGRALELGAIVRRIYFDKTGTLTDATFSLEDIRIIDEDAAGLVMSAGETVPMIDQLLRLAVALEAHSAHPIARAFQAAADPLTADRQTSIQGSVEFMHGMGVCAQFADHRVSLGRADLHGPPGDDLRQSLDGCPDLHPIVMWVDEHPVAIFAFRERVRPDAADLIASLRALHLEPSVMTGDSSRQAGHLAERLQLPAQIGLLPDQKREEIIRSRNETHEPICYVGDGVNDAPALAEADLGIAVHAGADLARASGDVVLLDDDLQLVDRLIRTARTVRRRIIISLIWMFSYNAVGFTLAFTGRLTPVYAAIAMIFSSLFIIINSSRGWGNGTVPVPPGRPESIANRRSNTAASPCPPDRLQNGTRADDVENLLITEAQTGADRDVP